MPSTVAHVLAATILGEHLRLRALLSQVDAFAQPARMAQAGGEPLRAALEQLDDNLLAHEDGEGRILFPRVQARCPPLGAVLGRMESEHAGMRAMLAGLIERAQPACMTAIGREEFAGDWARFSDTVLGHMSVEESYILPVANDFLLPGDWEEIASSLAQAPS